MPYTRLDLTYPLLPSFAEFTTHRSADGTPTGGFMLPRGLLTAELKELLEHSWQRRSDGTWHPLVKPEIDYLAITRELS